MKIKILNVCFQNSCCLPSQDSEIFINDKKTGTMETFWNPTSELRQSRLIRCTVPMEEQSEFESERFAAEADISLPPLLPPSDPCASGSGCGST